ncbi:MAG: hypothetical protein QOF48_3449 [Verrucomicrobiota bacterium]|jgi:hypothetical protein
MSRIALLLLLALSARAGTLQTLDGRTLVGRIQLDGGGTFLFWPTNGAPIGVDLTNLLAASFSDVNSSSPESGPRLRPVIMDEERGALPEPWRSMNAGRPEQPGSAVHYHGKYTAAVSRGAPGGSDEGCELVYQSFRGNVEIFARIASILPRDDQDRQTAAGLSIRSGTEKDASSLRITLTGSGSISVRKRSSSGGGPVNSLSTMRRPDRKPPYWLRLSREENVISAYHSADGRRWEFVQQTEMAMPDRILIGFLVAGRRRDSDGTAEFDHVTVRPLEARAAYTPRVVLKDGTRIADPFAGVDESSVSFSKDKSGLHLLTRHVARLEFRPIEEPELLPVGRTGVLFSTGDFVDGEFQCVTNGRIRLNSVLFGQRSFVVDRKVTAVILGDPSLEPAAFEVRTLDGSAWRARAIKPVENLLKVETAHLGSCDIPSAELKEIHRIPR